MKIKEIVLDGFKSYSQRTVISDFDDNFNAITGLNGSGKSNILDAICFVLGISSLATVRANHLQELIYKNGQAGVTKANVTILFDNSDKSRSHEAYKKFNEISVRREIALGGTSKYTINGTKVTGEKVRQLFSMSGLNVNNANFLVMQGRITQVINMKPNEILSLVEESAGTNVYEEHRRKALTLMDKKDRKLEEIENIMATDLLPKLEKLRAEKEQFMIWKSKKEELEELERKVVFAKYRESLEQSFNSEEILKSLEHKSDKNRKKAAAIRDKLSMVMGQLDKLRQTQVSDNVDIERQTIDEMFEALSRAEAEFESNLRLRDEKAEKIREIKAHVSKLQQDLNLVANQLRETLSTQQNVLEAATNKQAELDSLQSKKQALDQGLNIGVNIAQERVREKETSYFRQQMEAQEITERVAETEHRLAEIDHKIDNYSGRQLEESSNIEAIKTEIRQLQGILMQGDSSLDSRLSDLQEQNNRLEHEIAGLDRGIDAMDASRFNLRYPDPEPNFDRSKVKGRVIRLIELKNRRYARAVETGAGGRLYSVVVDTDQTAQLLLKRKSLGNVTFLPNNRMQPHVVPQDKKDLVMKRFPNRAHLALDLLEYDRENQKSIEYIFGRFFVCDNREIALAIAYDQNIRCMAVTVDGDTFDPNGIISGGDSHTSESKLSQLVEVKRLETRRAEYVHKQRGLEREIQAIRGKQKEVLGIKNEIELKKSQLRNRERLAEQSSYAHLQALKQEQENLLGMLRTKQEDYRKKLLVTQRELTKMKEEASQSGDIKSQLIREIKRVEKERKGIEKEKKQLMKEVTSLEQTKESVEEEIRDTKETQTEELSRLSALTAEITEERAKVDKLQEAYVVRKQDLDKLNEEILRNNQQCKALAESQRQLEKDLKAAEGDIQSTDAEKRSMLQKISMGKTLVQQYEEQYPWLQEVEYDLSSFDLVIEEPRFVEAFKELEKESKKINKAVSATLDDQEQKLAQLNEKKIIVMADKQEIQKLLDHLDMQKEICIERTWMAVDQNLSEIFSTLLPGADARLKKVDEKIKGLELAVGFNNNWKVNLSELSGGQRSLLALSFILALLKYNPAPIYILDEIDAALDMSHTQNIGDTVRKYFTNSQFIVVSLKEGMFTNANVLYRTSFHDGRSFIERIPLRQNPIDERRRITYR